MKKLLLAFFLLAPFPPLPAAETPAATHTPPFKFSLLSLDGDLDELYFRDGNNIHTTEAPSDFLRPPLAYPGGEPLQLFAGPPPRPDEKTSSKTSPPVPLLSLQPNRSGTYLVLLRKTPSDQYQTFWVETGELSDAANSWNFVNLGGKPVLGIFDQKKFQIMPGKSAPLSLGDKAGYLQGELFLPGKDHWALAYTTRFYHQPNRPRTYFILPNPSSPDHLLLKGIASSSIAPEEIPLHSRHPR